MTLLLHGGWGWVQVCGFKESMEAKHCAYNYSPSSSTMTTTHLLTHAKSSAYVSHPGYKPKVCVVNPILTKGHKLGTAVWIVQYRIAIMGWDRSSNSSLNCKAPGFSLSLQYLIQLRKTLGIILAFPEGACPCSNQVQGTDKASWEWSVG